jgi:hypothetical protein
MAEEDLTNNPIPVILAPIKGLVNEYHNALLPSGAGSQPIVSPGLVVLHYSRSEQIIFRTDFARDTAARTSFG